MADEAAPAHGGAPAEPSAYELARRADPRAVAVDALAELHPYHGPVPPRQMSDDALAARLADLAPEACDAELARRALPVERDRRPTPGVARAYRLTGPLRGVSYVLPRPPSVHGVLDCRLVLALDELAEVLRRHDVVRVRVDNTYRPGSKLPGRRELSQHGHALAADITVFWLADGTDLDVLRDYHGEMGAPSCGPDAVLHHPDERAIALRNLVCDIARERLFHHMLTPNFDAAHQNHFHFDIKRGKRWGGISEWPAVDPERARRATSGWAARTEPPCGREPGP